MKVSTVYVNEVFEVDNYLYPVVSVSVPTMMSVDEGDGTVEVCVTLSNVSAPTETSISVNIEAIDGTVIKINHSMTV